MNNNNTTDKLATDKSCSVKNKQAFLIQINSNPIPNNCPLCGNETNPNIGAELFLDDLVVCRPCGERHSENLASLLTLADASRLFSTSESNYGLLWQEASFGGGL